MSKTNRIPITKKSRAKLNQYVVLIENDILIIRLMRINDIDTVIKCFSDWPVPNVPVDEYEGQVMVVANSTVSFPLQPDEARTTRFIVVYVRKSDNKVIGCTRFRCKSNRIYMAHKATLPEVRGTGIGEKINDLFNEWVFSDDSGIVSYAYDLIKGNNVNPRVPEMLARKSREKLGMKLVRTEQCLDGYCKVLYRVTKEEYLAHIQRKENV